MGQVAAAQVVADRLWLDEYLPADSEHDVLQTGLEAARQYLGEDAPETTSLRSACRWPGPSDRACACRDA